MKILNRSALRLRARPAFLEWCASMAVEDGDELTALTSQLKETGTVYLITEVESEQDFTDAVLANAPDILKNELNAWCIDGSLWPAMLNAELLESWFTIDTELMCFDTSNDQLMLGCLHSSEDVLL